LKSGEIFLFVVLFILGFFLTEFIVNRMVLYSPFNRFVARLGFQLLFYSFIYLLFDSHDISQKHHNGENDSTENEAKDMKK